MSSLNPNAISFVSQDEKIEGILKRLLLLEKENKQLHSIIETQNEKFRVLRDYFLDVVPECSICKGTGYVREYERCGKTCKDHEECECRENRNRMMKVINDETDE